MEKLENKYRKAVKEKYLMIILEYISLFSMKTFAVCNH